MQRRELSDREKLFCTQLARMGEPAAAALKAGYGRVNAAASADRLLRREEVQAEVRRQRKLLQAQAADLAVTGLLRLAFGDVSDAAELVVREEPPGPAALRQLDLFGVAEIKQSRGGGLEVRFYDRMRALELLLRYGVEQGAGGDGTASFYNALLSGAASLGGDDAL